ncbi:hypothetical protein DKP76_09595 [Falsochrobactrum shanghaiense]|uniref:Uncharacterized protein n=1 Tax=Falsochrobactrum shanghaiense TaxID=2201899 RepID=A0A316J929_9HYPH|nr:hypothetical protein [Falsochrobactrum shanghaiense]PWL17984.1 hypothetical protein DKP76_09595 [Falsochrobactrum shanghaiense]
MFFLPADRRNPRVPDETLKVAVLAGVHLPGDFGFAGTKAAVFARDGLMAITVFRLAMVSLA